MLYNYPSYEIWNDKIFIYTLQIPKIIHIIIYNTLNN